MLAPAGRGHPGRPAQDDLRDPGPAIRIDRFTELREADVSAWLRFHLPSWRARALVVGCGTGVHTERLADRFNEVLAVDPDRPLVAYARRHRARGNIRYEVRHRHEVSVAGDGLFDLVFAAHLHRPVDRRAAVAALRHLRSLTRPEGTLLLTGRTGQDPTPDRASRWTFRSAAWRELRGDQQRFRRPVRDAVELLHLNLHRDVLAYQAAHGLWTRQDWDDLTAHVFPGARTIDLDRAFALYWRAPGPWAPT